MGWRVSGDRMFQSEQSVFCSPFLRGGTPPVCHPSAVRSWGNATRGSVFFFPRGPPLLLPKPFSLEDPYSRNWGEMLAGRSPPATEARIASVPAYKDTRALAVKRRGYKLSPSITEQAHICMYFEIAATCEISKSQHLELTNHRKKID